MVVTFHLKGLPMPGSNACFGIIFYVPLCYIQIQAELDVFPLICYAPRFAKMSRKPQHVGNVRAVPMLRFSWRDVTEGRHIQLSLNLYITQWDKIHDSITCF